MSNLVTATAKNRRLLWMTFGLTFTYFFAKIVGGLLTNSLALLADAAHMLTDVGGLGLSLFASWMFLKPATPTKTYGYYRVEILPALTGSVLVLATQQSKLLDQVNSHQRCLSREHSHTAR